MTAAEPTIIELRETALARLDAAHDLEATREWYREYLGDHGAVTALTKRIADACRRSSGARSASPSMR